MAQATFTIKLHQLERRLKKLHSRINLSETIPCSQLQSEIDSLKREVAQEEAIMHQSLLATKSNVGVVLEQCYQQVEQIMQQLKDQMQKMTLDNPDIESAAETKILFAEYALDFAYQVADIALLISLDAMNTQLLQEEGR